MSDAPSILIVDDEPVARIRLRELLKRMARHTASAHYYRKNYLRMKGNEQLTTGT